MMKIFQNRKSKNKNVKGENSSIHGITLISLVITIIVLVILSSVGIYLALGNNGILNKAEYAKNETTKQTATEKMNLKITNMQIEKYTKEQRMPTLQEFADGLCMDNEVEYVELQSKKVAALDKIQVGEADSIFTKLKEYPYEFEINNSLQLASIDGIELVIDDNTGDNSILWEGTSTEGAELELEENLSDYSFIEIYFRTMNTGTTGVACPILKYDASEIVARGEFDIYYCTGGWYYGSRYIYDASTNKLKNESNGYAGGTSYKLYTNFALEIYKIVGIK